MQTFGVKLTLRNKDEETFRLLWVDNQSSWWNLGHALECLRTAINIGWELGLQIILQCTKTVVLFESVT